MKRYLLWIGLLTSLLGISFEVSAVERIPVYSYKNFQPTAPVRTLSANRRNDDPLPTNRIRSQYAYNDPLFFPHIRARNQNNYEPEYYNYSKYAEAARSMRRKILREASYDDNLPFSVYSRDYVQDYSNNEKQYGVRYIPPSSSPLRYLSRTTSRATSRVLNRFSSAGIYPESTRIELIRGPY